MPRWANGSADHAASPHEAPPTGGVTGCAYVDQRNGPTWRSMLGSRSADEDALGHSAQLVQAFNVHHLPACVHVRCSLLTLDPLDQWLWLVLLFIHSFRLFRNLPVDWREATLYRRPIVCWSDGNWTRNNEGNFLFNFFDYIRIDLIPAGEGRLSKSNRSNKFNSFGSTKLAEFKGRISSIESSSLRWIKQINLIEFETDVWLICSMWADDMTEVDWDY